jgi:hypothetical protein
MRQVMAAALPRKGHDSTILRLAAYSHPCYRSVNPGSSPPSRRYSRCSSSSNSADHLRTNGSAGVEEVVWEGEGTMVRIAEAGLVARVGEMYLAGRGSGWPRLVDLG